MQPIFESGALTPFAALTNLQVEKIRRGYPQSEYADRFVLHVPCGLDSVQCKPLDHLSLLRMLPVCSTWILWPHRICVGLGTAQPWGKPFPFQHVCSRGNQMYTSIVQEALQARLAQPGVRAAVGAEGTHATPVPALLSLPRETLAEPDLPPNPLPKHNDFCTHLL
jgi:hypothetical protein